MAAKMGNAWWLILFSVTTGVAGQTVMKMGVSGPGAAEASTNIVSLVLLILRSPLVLSGLFLYAMGALAWISVLSRLDLSLAYPFLALNFVLITLISRLSGRNRTDAPLAWHLGHCRRHFTGRA